MRIPQPSSSTHCLVSQGLPIVSGIGDNFDQRIWCIFLNAEGKANSEDQLEILVGSVIKKYGRNWLIICFAEADFLDECHPRFQDLPGGFIAERKYWPGSRAMKIVVNASLRAAIHKVTWGWRCVCVSTDNKLFGSHYDVLFSHLGHGEEWFASVDASCQLLKSASWRCRRLWMGDLNVEGRPEYRRQQDHEKWRYLSAWTDALNILLVPFEDMACVTRKATGLQRMVMEDSQIDLCFASPAELSLSCDWDGAPGDHGWTCCSLAAAQPAIQRQARTWRCRGWEAFNCRAMEVCPQRFHSVDDFHSVTRSLMEECRDTASARARKRDFESLVVKELRRQARVCFNEAERREIQKRIFAARVQDSKLRRLNDSANALRAGHAKSIPKASLFPIYELIVDGQACKDQSVWAAQAEKDFGRRWNSSESGDGQRIVNMGLTQEQKITISDEQLVDALDQVSKASQMDHYGICVLPFLKTPCLRTSLKGLVEDLLGSDVGWDGIEIQGFVKGKVRSKIDISKTRGLLPQPCILKVLNAVVNVVVGPQVDAWSQSNGISSFVLGSSKGGQPADIAFCAAQVLEKARDRRNEGAIAQADIATYHDVVKWSTTCSGLLRRGIARNWVSACLRLHRCPKVVLRIGETSTRQIARTRGVLTGASTAGKLSRVVQEDTFLECEEAWEPYAFRISEEKRLSAMSWSDNLFAFGSSRDNAIKILNIWEQRLHEVGQYCIKDDSRTVICANTRKHEQSAVVVDGVKWNSSSVMKVLGYWLSAVGDSADDRKAVARAAEAAFWRNSKLLLNTFAPVEARIRQWTKLSRGIVEYKACLWPVQRTAFQELDAVQLKIVRRMAKVTREATDSDATFARKRNRFAARVVSHFGVVWSELWARKVILWVEHLWRHKEHPAFSLLCCQDDEWLRHVRALSGSVSSFGTVEAGSLGLRGGPGKPIRWGQGWLERISPENPIKDKEITAGNVMKLAAMVQYGKWQGEAVEIHGGGGGGRRRGATERTS